MFFLERTDNFCRHERNVQTRLRPENWALANIFFPGSPGCSDGCGRGGVENVARPEIEITVPDDRDEAGSWAL